MFVYQYRHHLLNYCLQLVINISVSFKATMFIRNTERYSKIFFIVSFCGLKIYAIIAFYTYTVDRHNSMTLQERIKKLPEKNIQIDNFVGNFKLRHILIWTPNNETKTNISSDNGQNMIMPDDCTYTNCIITTDKLLLGGNYSNFDAIVFNLAYIKHLNESEMPRRSPSQRYVFYSMLPSNEYPICSNISNDYFDWIWSYKLDSDIVAPFIEVKDLDGNVIAPNNDVVWTHYPSKLYDITQIEKKNQSKIRIIAWIINKCRTRVNRIKFVDQLKLELSKFNYVLDVYGCGYWKYNPKYVKQLLKHYYFYLVFEDSLSEDYLTSEIMKAFDNNLIPIVQSGADLRRFLPPRSYINAREFSIEKLAAKIDYLMRNLQVYYNYQNWRDYYTIQAVEHTRGICELCKFLNEENMLDTKSHGSVRKIWNSGSFSDRCYSKDEHIFEGTESNVL